MESTPPNNDDPSNLRSDIVGVYRVHEDSTISVVEKSDEGEENVVTLATQTHLGVVNKNNDTGSS